MPRTASGCPGSQHAGTHPRTPDQALPEPRRSPLHCRRRGRVKASPPLDVPGRLSRPCRGRPRRISPADELAAAMPSSARAAPFAAVLLPHSDTLGLALPSRQLAPADVTDLAGPPPCHPPCPAPPLGHRRRAKFAIAKRNQGGPSPTEEEGGPYGAARAATAEERSRRRREGPRRRHPDCPCRRRTLTAAVIGPSAAATLASPCMHGHTIPHHTGSPWPQEILLRLADGHRLSVLT